MDVMVPGRAVSITLPFVDYDERAIVPASLDYEILDENGDEVLALANILGFDANLGSHVITVTAAQNTLPATAVRALRTVRMRITDAAAATFWIESTYIVEVVGSLLVAVNSLQTYGEALLNVRDVAERDGWESATDEQRRTAMADAYGQMGNFSLNFIWGEGNEDSIATTYSYGTVRDLVVADMALLNSRQLADFKKAQLLQADYLLGGNVIEKDIADGLQSKTVGESSQFYRPRASLSMAISRRALSVLGKYINWSKRIARS